MKQPFNTKQNFSSSDQLKIIVVIIFLGILLIVLGVLVGLAVQQSEFHFSLPSLQTQATPASASAPIAPTLFVPATGCGSPTLVLGTTTFQIQNLTPSADGSLNVPADTSGIAYWIQVSNSNPVFVLSPTPQNITVMSSISIGSAATVTWVDCSSATYSLSAAQAGALDGSAFAAQSIESITVFFPTTSSGAGFVFKGKRITEPVFNPPTPVIESTFPASAVNTVSPSIENTSTPSVVPSTESVSSPTAGATLPPPDYSQVLAEIGLQDASLSLFRTSLKIEVSIYNFGTSPFTLSESSVTLTQPDGARLALKSSKPSLPLEIQPGETKTVELSFEPPASPTATLKILTVEYDVEGY